MGACPDDETIAEYLDQGLIPAHRQRLAAHLERCADCAEVVTEAKEVMTLLAGKRGGRVVPGQVPGPPAGHEEALAEGAAGADASEDEVAAAAKKSPRLPATQPPAPAHRRALLRSAAAAAALASAATAVLLLASPWAFWRDPPPAEPIATVPARSLVPRLSGEWEWAPPLAATEGVSRPPRLERGRGSVRPALFRSLVATQLDRLEADGLAASELAAAAPLQVLAGELDRGVDSLTRATAIEPGSPRLLSDLGAALLARAQRLDDVGGRAEDLDETAREGSAEDLPAALEAIERALAAAPRHQEALFNRALALEALHLPVTAEQAWRAYLAVDPSSPWAKEARRRLASIRPPARPNPDRLRAELAALAASGDQRGLAELVRGQRHLARRTVQEDLLPGWGEATLAGDLVAADRQLAAARALAAEWQAQTTDPTLRRAVEEAGRAGGQARRRFARGYQAVGEASRAFDAMELETAQSAADRALAELPEGSPGAVWARLLALGCAVYRGGETEAEIEALSSALGPKDVASRGRTAWMLGILRARRGDQVSALLAYRSALAAYEQLDELDPVVWLHYLLGEAYGQLGASAEGWRYRRLALAAAPRLTERRRVSSSLFGSAIVALFEGRPRVASDLLAELLAAERFDEPVQVTEAYTWRSRVRLTLGDRAGAREDFQRAAAWAARVTPLGREALSGHLSMAQALTATEPAESIAVLTRALASFQGTGNQLWLPGAFFERARAHARLGDEAAADADLRRGLALLSQTGAEDPFTRAWDAHLNGPDPFFDERVLLALRQGSAAEAFAVAEEGRARLLREAQAPGVSPLGERVPAAQTVASLRSRLQPGATMLFYSVLADRVVVWRIAGDGFALIPLSITPGELARLTSSLAADLAGDAWTAGSRRVALRLYAALVAPARPGGGPLIVVPDEALHGLPFAALVNPASGRYLVEERQVTVAPSATLYLRARDRWRALGAAPPRDALVVGDPRTDSTMFPGLAALPGAREEARQVAALYPERELLLGESAARPAVLAALGRREVLHFAGHAIANRVLPERSSFALAPGGRAGDGALFARDVAALRLELTRTVVLSACDTAAGAPAGGEGPLSLARAFLAAGTPSVVASLWPVADRAAIPLMTAFHQRLRRGEEPAAALRAAQLGLLRGPDPAQRSPAVWATFAALGG